MDFPPMAIYSYMVYSTHYTDSQKKMALKFGVSVFSESVTPGKQGISEGF